MWNMNSEKIQCYNHLLVVVRNYANAYAVRVWKYLVLESLNKDA